MAMTINWLKLRGIGMTKLRDDNDGHENDDDGHNASTDIDAR